MRSKAKQYKVRRMPAAAAAVFFFVICLGSLFLQADAETRQHTLTHYDTRFTEGDLQIGYFEIDGGTVAMCVCHELNPPKEMGTLLSEIAKYTKDNEENELLRKIYYYGWHGPADIGASFVETCLAGSVAYGHDDNFYGYGQAFIDRISGYQEAPRGFDVMILSDGKSDTQNLAYWEYHPTGYAGVKKVGTHDEITQGNSCYTLEGAEYGIYQDEECTSLIVKLTTDRAGETETAELPCGKYFLKEIKASNGYRLDQTVYPITVKADVTEIVETKEVPVWEEQEFTIYKSDAESGLMSPLGNASLEGGEFTVKFYAGFYDAGNLPEQPARTWILRMHTGTKEGKPEFLCKIFDEDRVSGDEFYFADDRPVLPLGTLVIEETKAPEGYLTEGVYFQAEAGQVQEGRYLTHIYQNLETAEIEGGYSCSASDYVVRGDLELVKIGDGNHQRLAGVPFQITSQTTGESHIIITDENGYASTSAAWNPHTEETNQAKTSQDGIWFGLTREGNITVPDDERGALPYDTYTVEELRSEGNREYELIPPFTVTVRKNKTVIPLGTMTNDELPEIEEEEEIPETPEVSEIRPVKTGDTENAAPVLITCILSCVAILSCGMIARKMNKD